MVTWGNKVQNFNGKIWQLCELMRKPRRSVFILYCSKLFKETRWVLFHLLWIMARRASTLNFLQRWLKTLQEKNVIIHLLKSAIMTWKEKGCAFGFTLSYNHFELMRCEIHCPTRAGLHFWNNIILLGFSSSDEMISHLEI